MHALKVVLVDDHAVLRMGVRDFVDSLPGFTIVGEAATAGAALEIIESTQPDIVLMDIVLPGIDGIVATREICRRIPSARVVVLTAHRQNHDVHDAIDAGAIAYVLKGDPPETLVHALEHAARGAPYVAPVLARCVSTVEDTDERGRDGRT